MWLCGETPIPSHSPPRSPAQVPTGDLYFLSSRFRSDGSASQRKIHWDQGSMQRLLREQRLLR